MILPVITLCGPWAQWVAMGLKKIETRTHNRFQKLKGQRIGIHVSKRWDSEAPILAKPYVRPEHLHINPWSDHLGRIICVAFVADARPLTAEDSPLALIDCGKVQRFGLILEDAMWLKYFIPAKGSLGIWRHEVRDDHLRPLPHSQNLSSVTGERGEGK